MKHHRYRFGLKGNIKVFLCRTFGHRINENPAHHWCERCGLAYEECYHPLNYYEEKSTKPKTTNPSFGRQPTAEVA